MIDRIIYKDPREAFYKEAVATNDLIYILAKGVKVEVFTGKVIYTLYYVVVPPTEIPVWFELGFDYYCMISKVQETVYVFNVVDRKFNANDRLSKLYNDYLERNT